MSLLNHLTPPRRAGELLTDPAHALCWAAEVQMATVEELEMRKSTPKYVLERHQSIRDSLVYAVAFHEESRKAAIAQAHGGRGRTYHRLSRVIEEAMAKDAEQA